MSDKRKHRMVLVFALCDVCPSCGKIIPPGKEELIICPDCDIAFHAEDLPSQLIPINIIKVMM